MRRRMYWSTSCVGYSDRISKTRLRSGSSTVTQCSASLTLLLLWNEYTRRGLRSDATSRPCATSFASCSCSMRSSAFACS